jgi:FkbM family methyltransferase
MNIEVILKYVVERGDTVFDVGGYVGDVAWFMTRCVGPQGKVYSFEPNPESFQALKAKADKHSNLTALNCAISNSPALVTLHFGVTEESSQASTICPDLATTDRLGDEIKFVQVQAITLDQFCAEHGLVPSVIKLDVEGAEALVLEGARGILERRPTLIFEMGVTTSLPVHVIELRKQGYEIYLIEVHRFVSDPVSWEHTVNTETRALRNRLISFEGAELERLAPFFSNVLAIAPKKREQLASFSITSLAEAMPFFADPKQSLSAKFKGVVRRLLIPRALEERFPGFVATLRNFGRRI